MRRVFDLPPQKPTPLSPRWTPLAFFDATQRCVASIEVAVLPLVCDGRDATATAVRLVATDPAWRGQGLFRDLMERALALCATMSDGPCLLYTAEPAIYDRFGFLPLEQHAFVGAPPTLRDGAGARTLDVSRADDRRLVERLLETRTPVSDRCAVVAAPALFMSFVTGADDLVLAYDAAGELLVAYERDDDCVTIVDVVAAAMPPLDVILRAIKRPITRLKTLFPPDRLGWDGEAVAEDTGLMARGQRPAAMTRPFMLPPTTGF